MFFSFSSKKNKIYENKLPTITHTIDKKKSLLKSQHNFKEPNTVDDKITNVTAGTLRAR